MSTYRCRAVECGRVYGVRNSADLCDYHKADFHAGVEIPLDTGYALRKDVFGHAQIRRIHGKIEAQSNDRNAGALRQQPPAWHQHERTV